MGIIHVFCRFCKMFFANNQDWFVRLKSAMNQFVHSFFCDADNRLTKRSCYGRM